MTYYPVEAILALYPENPIEADALFKSQQFDPECIKKLVMSHRSCLGKLDAQTEVLKTMLRHIPPDKQRRVLHRIHTETKSRDLQVTDLRWWDIQPSWRNLCFTIHHHGKRIPVTMMWRKTDKDAPTLNNPSVDIINDPIGEDGKGIEFHAEFYQQLKPQFIAWLDSIQPRIEVSRVQQRAQLLAAC